MSILRPVLLLLTVAAPAEAAEWTVREAEHLINRAGFGARPEAIEELVQLGRKDAVELLLAGPTTPPDPYYVQPLGPRDLTRSDKAAMAMDTMDRDERKGMIRQLKRDDQLQLSDYKAWWVERMLEGEDPLRERMTLFWHGYFTSSSRDVKSSYEIIRQNQFLRDNALGKFGDLLDGISRDPAMLEYLDNDSNVRSHPNENFARELLELFTLGEGHYSEDDVLAAARAFTGWTDRDGEFQFRPRKHDFGEKTFLGVEGRLNGADVIEILLEQEQCARRLASRLIGYLEGVEPTKSRVKKYARLLLANDYDLALFLEELFTDRNFYRDDVVGTRIAGPIDFLVGYARRLGVRPPARLLVGGATALGQSLLDPPNVKGWEGGPSWITTSSLMLRGNLAGFLVGAVDLSDVMRDGRSGFGDVDMMEATLDGDGVSSSAFGSAFEGMRGSGRLRWKPRLNFSWRVKRSGAVRDEQIAAWMCSDLLGTEVEEETVTYLVTVLEEERRARGVGFRNLLDLEGEAESILRSLAHVILSLPEAQLH